jgi:hypothetical protein
MRSVLPITVGSAERKLYKSMAGILLPRRSTVKKLVLSIVLVSIMLSLLAPVAFAGGPPNGESWLQKAKNRLTATQTQAQKTFFNSGKAVQTGVPGVRANDLTSAEGRAAFRAPKLGASQWYNNAATSAINAAQNAYNNQ